MINHKSRLGKLFVFARFNADFIFEASFYFILRKVGIKALF